MSNADFAMLRLSMLLDMIFPNGRFKSLEVDRRVTLPSHMLAAHLYCIFAPCHFRGRVGVVSKYLRMSHFCTFIRFRTILVHICRDSNLDPNPNSSVNISQTILSALGAHGMTHILYLEGVVIWWSYYQMIRSWVNDTYSVFDGRCYQMIACPYLR